MTDILFVAPDFLSGIARSIDIGAALERSNYVISRTPEEADARAIRNDVEVVGKDLAAAIEKVAD